MSYCKKLLFEYDAVRSKEGVAPSWAVRKLSITDEYIPATIPFVGKSYGSSKPKLLLYASAENLNGYDGRLDDEAVAANRHRIYFDNSVKKCDRFFPLVHIKPIEDGSLALAAMYIYSKFSGGFESSPCEFLEKISFGNFGKFSIASNRRNLDYASNSGKIAASLSYIKSDIEILSPDIIIMPKTIYETEREFIDSIRGDALIIPMYQINATTVNSLIAKKHSKANLALLPGDICLWYKNLSHRISGKTKENYLSVFTYLDELIKGIR